MAIALDGERLAAVRADCLHRALLSIGGVGSPDMVLDIAKQFERFVLSGATATSSAGPVMRASAQAGRSFIDT